MAHVRIVRGAAMLAIAVASFAMGRHTAPDGNAVARYSDGLSLPMNCRALIHDNVSGVRNKTYTPAEALASIERNCGAFGSLWGHK